MCRALCRRAVSCLSSISGRATMCSMSPQAQDTIFRICAQQSVRKGASMRTARRRRIMSSLRAILSPADITKLCRCSTCSKMESSILLPAPLMRCFLQMCSARKVSRLRVFLLKCSVLFDAKESSVLLTGVLEKTPSERLLLFLQMCSARKVSRLRVFLLKCSVLFDAKESSVLLTGVLEKTPSERLLRSLRNLASSPNEHSRLPQQARIITVFSLQSVNYS